MRLQKKKSICASPIVIKRNVLISINNNFATERAFNWYLVHLTRKGDMLHLLNVIEPIYKPTSQLSGGQVELLVDEMKEKTKKNIDASMELGKKYSEMCRTAGVHSKFQYILGSPAKEVIVNYAKDNAIELLVLGSRGTGNVRKTLLGKVSSYVVHHSHVPICIVPPEV